MSKIVSSGRALHSSEFYTKKKRRRKKLLYLYLLLIIFFVFGSVLLLRKESFQIKYIESEFSPGGPTELVEGILEENYLWLIPKSNFLLFPRRSTKRAILENFPRFYAVKFDLENKETLRILVKEREVYAQYCEGNVSGECYAVDKEGLIFDRYIRDGNFIYTLPEFLGDPVGKYVLPKEEFLRINNFKERLAKLGINASGLEITNDNFILKLLQGGEVIWRREASEDSLYSDLEAFLLSPDISSQSEFLEKVLYLDLRTEDKIFFKYK